LKKAKIFLYQIQTKIKHKTNFLFTKIFFKTNWTIQNFYPKISIFQFILKSLFFNILKVLALIIIFSILDNTVFKELNVTKISNSELLDYIIGGLSLAGILLGLYSSNIMSIYSTKYANAPERIRALFEKDRITLNLTSSISNYFFTCTVTLLLLIFKIKIGLIYVSWLSLYTLYILISYRLLGNSALKLIESFNLATEPIQNLYRVFNFFNHKPDRIHSDISLQEHLKKIASNNIADLNLILQYNLDKNENSSKPASDFSKRLLMVIYKYWLISNTIPYFSNWYKEISKFSKWHLSDQITLSIFIETKSHIPPKVKKNELWVEEELFSIEESILDYFMKNNDYDSITHFFTLLNSSISKIDSLNNLASILSFLTRIQSHIIDTFLNDTTDNQFTKKTQLTEIIAVTYSTLLNQILQSINKIHYETIYSQFKNKKFFFKPVNTKKYWDLFNGLETELKIEGHQITPKKSIIEAMSADIKLYIEDFLTKEVFSFYNLYIKFGERQFKSNNFFNAYIIFNHLSTTQKSITDLFKNNTDTEIAEQLSKKSKNIDNYLLKCSLQIYDKVNNLSIDFPDVIGYLFNQYTNKMLEFIISNDAVSFKNELKTFETISVYQTKNVEKTTHTEPSNGELCMLISPRIEYLTICGYACFWGDITKNPVWGGIIKDNFKIGYATDDLSKKAEELSSMCTLEKNLGILATSYRGLLHNTWETKFMDVVTRKDLLTYTVDSYGQEWLSTDNTLIKQFLGNAKLYSPSLSPLYEYYAVTILNTHLSDTNQYITARHWNER